MSASLGLSSNMKEQRCASASGYLMFAIALACLAGAFVFGRRAALLPGDEVGFADGALVVGLVLAAVFVIAGLYMQQPNTARAFTLFGSYRGTDRESGLRWVIPFYKGQSVSLRARNLPVPTLKVNDRKGNPIEIGAAVVWRVADTAKALFAVDDYAKYVQTQAEAALRDLASQYAYDHSDGDDEKMPTLRGNVADVGETLKNALHERFAEAGIEVLDARLTHLAYAPEIAQVMLRRQQAEAVISARSKIVQGAVSMVEAALQGLTEKGLVSLDDERKAAMVSNLLVVLCADREATPVVNTGTLYN